jgi:putative transposase
MMRFLQPLWLLLTTSKDSDLRQMIEYLKNENEILRSKLPDRITLTARERNRLVKFGSKIGGAIRELITIVSYRTFCRWRADTEPSKDKKKVTKRKPGRPKTKEEIRELILKLAREINGWGSTRVLGELKKLGITTVGRTTVAEIMREAGLDPGPKRGEGSWDEFVKRHAATLWAADFLTVKSMTLTGFVDLHLLFFIHIGSRRVFVSSPTANPDSAWVAQQARNVSMQMEDWGLTARMLIIDHDTKFTRSFDAVFEVNDTEMKRVGPRSPNMNAYAERFVQTVKTKCLNLFVVCGEKHLNHLVREFVTHYHEERPHQSRGNVPLSVALAKECKSAAVVPKPAKAKPTREPDEPRILKFPSNEVKCRERLGGVLKHYYREAA